MRLVTFNILHGAGRDDGVVDTERLAAVVRALDPDLLALQEVDRAQPRSRHADLTDVAARAMGAVDQRFVPVLRGLPGSMSAAPVDPDDPGTAAYGVALLSRYPATAWRVLTLPRLPTRSEEPRVLVTGRFATPLGELTAACTHLSYLPGWGLHQLRTVRRALAGVDGPVLLMGDLNLSAPLPALVTGYRSLARRRTFPAHHPVRQIDHLLLRGDLGPVRVVDPPPTGLSDHRALVVDVG